MLRTLRTMTIVGCLMLPLVSYGASTEGDAKSDQELKAKIQKAIADDDSLKAIAGAVNVTVQDGVITLKGTVQSDELSQSIQAKAESLAIQATPIERIHSVVVHNGLTVVP